jgi:hypothetical protein
MDDNARAAVRRWEGLKGARGTLETLWQEIGELTWPQAADFTVMRLEGEKRGLQQYDASSATALNEFASGMWGSLTNSAVDWLQLRHPDDELNDDRDVTMWMDAARLRMQQSLAAQGAGFYTSALQTYKGLGAFGTAVIYVDEVMGKGRLRFMPLSLAECCIDQDDAEMVSTMLRRFKLKAHQVVSRGERDPGFRVPERARKAVADGKPDDQFEFIHAVQPNGARDSRRRDAGGMAWASLHICLTSMEVVKSGGFREFPFLVPRWGTVQRGLYGESPVMSALTDIKVLNSVERYKLVAGQKAADPPLLAHDENVARGIAVFPGGIIYGGISPDGVPMVQPLNSGADFRVYEGMAEQKREAIRIALHNTVMLMQPKANATATEVLEMKEERLRLLGPQLSRIEQELLEPLTSRVFGLLWRAQAFDPVPEAMAADPRVQVEYVSQLTVAQKSGAAASVLRALSSVAGFAQLDPSIMDNIDMDEATRRIMAGYGAPPAIMRDPKTVAAEREQRAAKAAQMEQMQMAAGAAQPMAQAARGVRDLVEASSAAGGAEQVPA